MGGAAARSSSRPSATAGPAPTLVQHDDDPAEAAAVAAQIADLVAGGTAPADIAVLFRTNGQSEVVESALADRGIPYLVRGGERFFQRKEVREAVVLIRGAARSDDGSVTLPELVRDVLLGAGWSRDAPNAGGASRERWESLAALAALADDIFAADGEARMPAFVRELDERDGRAARAVRAGSDARVAARRQGARVGDGLPHRRAPTATCRSRWPTPPRRSRRSGDCSTSVSRGPATGSSSRGRARAPRGPGDPSPLALPRRDSEHPR